MWMRGNSFFNGIRFELDQDLDKDLAKLAWLSIFEQMWPFAKKASVYLHNCIYVGQFQDDFDSRGGIWKLKNQDMYLVQPATMATMG